MIVSKSIAWFLLALPCALLACEKSPEREEARVSGRTAMPSQYGTQQGMAQSTKGATGSPAGETAQRNDGRVIAVAQYVVTPVDYVGMAVEGEAQVRKVISDRAFWLDVAGKDVLAVVREDVPQHEMIDIDAGQTIRFQGLALTPGAMDNLTGTLEEDTKRAIQGEPTFIAMYWRDVTIQDRKGKMSQR